MPTRSEAAVREERDFPAAECPDRERRRGRPERGGGRVRARRRQLLHGVQARAADDADHGSPPSGAFARTTRKAARCLKAPPQNNSKSTMSSTPFPSLVPPDFAAVAALDPGSQR